MSIKRIERIPEGHSGCSINEKFERTYYRVYWIYTDNVTDDEYYIRTNLPNDPSDGQRLTLYASYEQDGGARLKTIQCDRGGKASWDGTPGNEVNLGNRWTVRCEWGTIDPREASADGNPFEVRPDVTIDGVALQKPFELDINGKPVLNSAFDYFDPPPMTDEQNHVIKITRNENVVPIATVIATSKKINAGIWYQWPDQTVKVEPIQLQILYSQFLDDLYFRITYTFIYNPDGWKRKFIDAGFRGLDSATGELIDLTDLHGKPLQDAVMLDGHGNQLPYPVDKDNIVTLEFDEFQAIDFSTWFNFPPDLFG